VALDGVLDVIYAPYKKNAIIITGKILWTFTTPANILPSFINIAAFSLMYFAMFFIDIHNVYTTRIIIIIPVIIISQ